MRVKPQPPRVATLHGRVRHRRARGFTLIEMSVALLLVALLVGLSVPAMESVTATQLRRSAGQLAGMSREAYARAAISGRPHRVVMDLDEHAFWLEHTSEFFVLGQEKATQLSESENERRKKGDVEPAALPKGFRGRSSGILDEKEKLQLELAKAPEWSPVEDELGLHTRLPNDCEFEKVWVAHQSEAFTRGQSMIHFWPNGQGETAVIRLTDDPERRSRVISVKVYGLTGRSTVMDRALEIPSS